MVKIALMGTLTRTDRRRMALQAFFNAKGPRSLTGICNRAGVSAEAVRAFLKGRSQSLTQSTYDKLAQSEDVPVTVLLGEEKFDRPATPERTVVQGRGATDIAMQRPRQNFQYQDPWLADPAGRPHGAAPLRAVRVLGNVQGGAFSAHPEWDAEDQYDIMWEANPGLARVPLFGLVVVGESVNREFPHGSTAICARLLDLGTDFEVKPGTFVVVYCRNAQAEIEVTIKQLEIDQKGDAWLWPRSDHPEFQTPIRVQSLSDRTDDDANDDVQIWAIVVGKSQRYAF